MGVRSWLTARLLDPLVNERVNLAVRALDDPRDRPLNQTDRDRYPYDRETILRDALEAWRVNPLARRIVELTSQYVVGSGLGIESSDMAAHAFLQEWWSNRLNNLSIRSFEWCDELTRSGELFIVISTDAAGMSYMRAIPALEIKEIRHRGNDIEQGLNYIQKAPTVGDDDLVWPAYNESMDDGQAAVMLHYAINRPIGAQRGESDLAPLLRWLNRYSAWLEDRVRLNRLRQAFSFVVYGHFENEARRIERQNALNANPPGSGSILVVNRDHEEWSVLEPKLNSSDANEDGLALKKMIAAGAGIPLHFLAEPESATRTTAEASGGPTFRHYDQRQQFFVWLLSDLARVALRRYARVAGINGEATISVHGTDISTRDNTQLAASASQIVSSFGEVYASNLIPADEFLRMIYKFAGEVVDINELMKRARSENEGETWKGNQTPNTGNMKSNESGWPAPEQ